MIYQQPITFYAIVREVSQSSTEIAEHPDGAMKAYAERWKANEALMEMKPKPSEGWRIDEILMVPPPMTSAAKAASVDKELRAAGVRR